MMYNSLDRFYKNPFGAVPQGTEICFHIKLDKEMRNPKLNIYKESDLKEPYAVVPMYNIYSVDGGNLYECKVTGNEVGLFYYSFSFNRDGVIGRGENHCGQRDSDRKWQLTIYDRDFKANKAFGGRVCYQIFPDRFYDSGVFKTNVPEDRIIHNNWYEEPVSTPDKNGKFLCNDYFGGDLRGITEKLPYLRDLGVEIIYLNPIFEAHSNHRYNTADYMKIDSLLGDEEDFKELTKTAHRNGIKIILDGVFNHTGSDSIYFNREKRYGEGGAYNTKNSPYSDWYTWKKDGSYDCWWGFETLPDVNENSPAYRKFICGEDGVLRHWLRLGADGWRLDVADELPDDFIADIKKAVKRENPKALLLGEVWEDASNKISYSKRRKYFLGSELDGVMNYMWRNAIVEFIKNGGGEKLEDSIMTLLENYPAPVIPTLLNSLSTHDINRAITELGGLSSEGKDRSWQREHNRLSFEQYYLGRQRFLLAELIQFTLPGMPCIYYGDEAGCVGYADPFNRGTYPWGKEDMGIHDFTRLLVRVRKLNRPLTEGEFKPVWFDDSTAVYTMEYGRDRILVAVNRSNENQKINFNRELLDGAKILLKVGSLADPATLGGHSGVIMKI